MRVLLIKTSSMGDVIHNLPVVWDLHTFNPQIEIDWVVEESFQEIVSLQPLVHKIIPIKFRQWRKALFSTQTHSEWKSFLTELQSVEYNYVIDTQGLIKSAWLGKHAQTIHYIGYDWFSIREPLASFFYTKKYAVPKAAHAIERNRALVANTFCYSIENIPNSYHLELPPCQRTLSIHSPYFVFLHATSRADKCWPESEWIKLGKMLRLSGYNLLLPWGNVEEHDRSNRLKQTILQNSENTYAHSHIIVPDAPLSLTELAHLLKNAQAVIGVDTGLSHLAVAVDVPTIGLYGTTYPALTGLDQRQKTCSLGNAMGFPVVEEVMTVLHQWHVLE